MLPARYDALAAVYGSKLVPPIKTGDRQGITPDRENFRVEAQTMERFLDMNAMRRHQQ